MSFRSRDSNNREQRNTTKPAASSGGAGSFAIKLASDFTGPATGAETGYKLVFDGTDFYLVADGTSTPTFLGAHGETDGTSSLVAAVNNTWQAVPFQVSLISDVTVCPLSFFTAGGSTFTVPEDGYYHVAFNLALALDPQLYDSTLDFGLFRDGALQRTFAVVGPDWAVNYSEIPEFCTAGTVFTLKFRRNGSGYADAVNLASRANFICYKMAATLAGSVSSQALNQHTDTNFPTPATGDAVVWSGSEWINGLPAMAFGDLTNANANLAAPGAGQDHYVLEWNNSSSSYKLVVNTAVAAPHALDGHTDTDLGTPGAGEDTYYVGWNNGTSMYELFPPDTPGPHTLDSHSNVTISGIASGQSMRWNGSAWVNYTTNLDSLSDVVVSAPAPGQVIQYNGTNFVNQNLVITLNLDDLANVAMGGKAVNSVVRWNGTAWVPVVLDLNSLSGVNVAGATAGQVLTFNGSTWVAQAPSTTLPAAAFVYAVTSGSGWSTGSSSGASRSGDTLVAGSAGYWECILTTNGGTGSVVLTTSAGGSSATTNWATHAIAYLTAGQYFTLPTGVGITGNATMKKIGT